jgi:hypothetical protein
MLIVITDKSPGTLIQHSYIPAHDQISGACRKTRLMTRIIYAAVTTIEIEAVMAIHG